MKKIIILLLIVFLTSGCYDYIELNNLSIITGISVDYKDDKYIVAYEILNEQKEGKESSKKSAVVVSAKGKNIAEAFNNAAKETPKKPYYPHLKCLVISESVAKNKLEGIIDYFLRNPDIRSEFDTVIAHDIDALELLSSSTEDMPVISDVIESLLETNKYYKNNTATAPFEEMVTDILLFGEEAEMAVITKKDNLLNISGIGIFKDYKLKGILTPQESITYNVLTGNAMNATYTIPCNDNYLTLGIYKSKPSIDITNKNVNINVELSGSIIESNCNYNFKDTKVYKKLNKKYAQVIKKDISDFIDTTLTLDSDILGIRRAYYLKYRKKHNDIWKALNYNINTNLKINKKGLIFEVENDY